MSGITRLVQEIHRRSVWNVLGIYFILSAATAAAQTPRIGTIDYYGLRTVSEDAVRSVLSVEVGDPKPSESERSAIESRLMQIPGVVAARLQTICCGEGVRLRLYVGIAEDSTTLLEFHPPPQSEVTLPEEIVASHADFSRALEKAVRAGNTGDDFSQGHSLMSDPAGRAVQERFLIYAEEHLEILREVLRSSSDPQQRAIAAQVIGYAPEKYAVVDDLVYAVQDPDDDVRNNAARALGAIAALAQREPGLGIRIPATPFVEMLNSLSWSDRNKATMVLVALTEGGTADVLQRLRERALDALVEMARWKSEGHAFSAYVLLSRVAGLSDQEMFEAWSTGERERFIEKAVESIRTDSASAELIPGGSSKAGGRSALGSHPHRGADLGGRGCHRLVALLFLPQQNVITGGGLLLQLPRAARATGQAAPYVRTAALVRALH